MDSGCVPLTYDGHCVCTSHDHGLYFVLQCLPVLEQPALTAHCREQVAMTCMGRTLWRLPIHQSNGKTFILSLKLGSIGVGALNIGQAAKAVRSDSDEVNGTGCTCPAEAKIHSDDLCKGFVGRVKNTVFIWAWHGCPICR